MSSPSFVWNAAAVATGLDEISRLRPALLASLKALLDEFHGVSRPVEYHDLIAGMWLESLTHNIYTAWREVLNGNIPTVFNPIPIVRNLMHAQAITANIVWHEHLRSAVARLMDGQTTDNWPVEQTCHIDIKNSQIKRLVNDSLRSISTSKPKLLMVSPCIKSSRLEQITLSWRWRKWIARDELYNPVYINAVSNWKWRKQKSSDISAHAYGLEELVTTLLPLYIPLDLLEGFDNYRNLVLTKNTHRPQVLFSATALHGNLAFKLLAAEWRGEGTKLLYQQHGGGYGLEPHLAVEEYEIRVSDRFYSWGWRRNGFNVTPLSPSMPILKKRYRNHKVLLNCLDLPRVPYRLMFTPMPGTIEIMHQNTYDFLRVISSTDINLTIRPYPHDYGWGAVDSMRAVAPEAIFDSRSRGLSHYETASLVVHNYLGTSWLETIGLNIPTVCFFDPAIYIYRKETQAYIAALQRVGILHNSGEAAAGFVSSLGNDIDGWWMKPEVQEARNRFVEQYANFSPDWAMQWEREFLSVIDEI